MSIKEIPSHEEFYLYEVLRHPAFCWEFIQNVDRSGADEPFELTEYQQEFTCDFNMYVSLTCARSVGKCLDKDARILNTETGEYHTVKEWYNLQKTLSIPSIGQSKYSQKTGIAEISPNGEKEVFEITTRYGYKTAVTAEHPFLTSSGWKEVKDLEVGDFIASPSSLPYFGNLELDDLEVKYLGYFIAEGSRGYGAITTSDQEVVDDLIEYSEKFGMGWYYGREYAPYGFYFSGSARTELLDRFGIRDCNSTNKFIPAELFSLNERQLGMLLRAIFDGDGCASKRSVEYCSSSEQLARDIKHLLLRFGIITSYSYSDNGFAGRHTLNISTKQGLIKFKDKIGFGLQRKQESLEKLIAVEKTRGNNSDIIPIKGMGYRVKRHDRGERVLNTYNTTREKAQRIINKDERLEKLLSEDVYWLKITDIINLGLRETYSVENDTTSTLVADDLYSHNTESISAILIWLAINNPFPDDYVVYLVPNKAQLDPVWNRTVRLFRHNSVLKHFITGKTGINSGEHKLTLLNGAILMMRLAGTKGDGANVIGLHTPFYIIDEAASFPWGTYLEAEPIFNTWTPGARKMVSGVPNGFREKNVLYFADMQSDSYTKHRIPAHRNPRYTEEDEARNRELYGQPEEEDYIHYVLGRHGKPTFAVFDRALMDLRGYPVHKLTLDGLKMREADEFIDRLSAIPVLKSAEEVIFGIDLGYTDPTAIYILRLDRQERFFIHAKIQLNKVRYPTQTQIIDYLDSRFHPLMIGIDEGHAGIAEIQKLMYEERFAHKRYQERIVPIQFTSNITIGFDEEGKEINRPARPYAITVLQTYTNDHKIVYSMNDIETVAELERMVFVRTPSGNKVYKTLTPGGGQKGNDHFTSALLCASLGWFLKNESLMKPQKKAKKLAMPGWMR